MRKFLLDTVLCSLFIFGIMGLFSSVTYFKIFDLFDPIGDMFADFEMSDLVMSKLRDAPPASEDIVVVNIAHANREEIGYMIQILEKYQPSVIGVDVTFASPKPYAEDSVFEQTLAMYDNVVIGSELRLPVLEAENVNYGFDTLVVPEERLAQHADFGFVNLLTNAENQEDVKFCRELVLRARVRNMEEEQLAFAVKLAQYKDPEATQVFLNRGNVVETVNYKGNVIGAQSTLGTRYFALDIHEVFNEAFTPDLLKDKVVIMCFLGAYIGDLNTRQDLYFTPLNKNYVGKAEPDMFGGVIHANTVSMILEGDYIDSMSQNTGIVLAILTCLVIVFCFKWVYGALPKWYDGITKIVQLILVIGISILMMVLFNWYNYKAELSLVIIVIALSGDSIEVYHGVVKNLFSKRESAQLFKVNRKFWKE